MMRPGCSQRISRGSGRCGRDGGLSAQPEAGPGPPFSDPRRGHCPSSSPDKGQPRARNLNPHPEFPRHTDSLPSPQLAGTDLAMLEHSQRGQWPER